MRGKLRGRKIILGVDPGTIKAGYGVVEVGKNDSLLHIASGVFELGLKSSLPERLLRLGNGIRKLIEMYVPGELALEKSFFAKNVDSASKLGHARGVCLYEAQRGGLKIFEYNPTAVKLGLTGEGHASKEKIQLFVKAILGVSDFKTFDTSDALAIALHHGRVGDTLEKLKSRELEF